MIARLPTIANVIRNGDKEMALAIPERCRKYAGLHSLQSSSSWEGIMSFYSVLSEEDQHCPEPSVTIDLTVNEDRNRVLKEATWMFHGTFYM